MRSAAAHHIHHRKRGIASPVYPHPDRRIELFDKFIMVISVIYPLTTLPQVYVIWVQHNAAGISLLTWVLYFFCSAPLLVYGIIHKTRPLIVMYVLWLLMFLLVIVGTLLYG